MTPSPALGKLVYHTAVDWKDWGIRPGALPTLCCGLDPTEYWGMAGRGGGRDASAVPITAWGQGFLFAPSRTQRVRAEHFSPGSGVQGIWSAASHPPLLLMGNLTASKLETEKGCFLGLTFPHTAEPRLLYSIPASSLGRLSLQEGEEGWGREYWWGKELLFILTHQQDRSCLVIVPLAKITGLNIICSALSIYHSGIFSNINYVLCVLVLLVLTFFPILQPQIAKVNLCCLLCFS